MFTKETNKQTNKSIPQNAEMDLQKISKHQIYSLKILCYKCLLFIIPKVSNVRYLP